MIGMESATGGDKSKASQVLDMQRPHQPARLERQPDLPPFRSDDAFASMGLPWPNAIRRRHTNAIS
jgi:hypothetical protein